MAKTRDEAEKEARDVYVRIGSIPCPKLGGEPVAFNRIGFRHLIIKHGTPRPANEQKRRFLLLHYAAKIISNPRVDVIQRTKGQANFWMFKEKHDGRTVKVIVRQLKGGKKHFYSIFSDKKKPPSD